MRKVEGTISSGITGLPILHARVSILKADNTPAQLYSDQGVTPLDQPVLTDGLGYYSFFIADGTYTRVVANPDGSNPITFPLEEMYEDARNVSVPVGEAGITLPPAGARMGRVLGFDSSGAPIAFDPFVNTDPTAAVAQEALLRAIADSDERTRATGVEGGLNTRLTAAETDIDALQGTITSGRREYASYASAVADAATPALYPAVTLGTVAEVPLTDAGTHTDPVVGGTVNNSGIFRWSVSPAGFERIADVDAVAASGFATAAASSAGSAAGSATTAVAAVAINVQGMAQENQTARNYDDTGNIWWWFVDKGEGGLLGIDQSTGFPVGVVADRFALSQSGDQGVSLASLGVSTLPSLAAASGWNGLILYGQSNSGGTDSNPALSTTTPYTGMKTFGSGPKSSKAGNAQGALNTSPGTSTVIALVEDANQSDGFTPSGETMCSGAARRFLELAATYNGIDPNTTTILASAAGHGSYRITNLNKGAAWYQQLLDHVSEGKARATAAGKSYAVQAVPFIQGEQDAQGGNTGSGAYANYLAYLLQLQIDVDTDIRAITGQTQPVHLLISPNPYQVTVNPEVTMAQVDACDQSAYIHLAGSRYHLSHGAGLVHLTNVSKIRHAADFGRAWYQLVYGARKPDQIKFTGATASGTTLTIACRVPQLPLVFDTVNLPSGVQDYGFKVVDDTGTLTLSNITIRGRTITITLNRALGNNPKLRYALDYLPSTILVSGNAAGNLRDSTQDTYPVNGTTYQHYYVAPPKQLNILKLAS